MHLHGVTSGISQRMLKHLRANNKFVIHIYTIKILSLFMLQIYESFDNKLCTVNSGTQLYEYYTCRISFLNIFNSVMWTHCDIMISLLTIKCLHGTRDQGPDTLSILPGSLILLTIFFFTYQLCLVISLQGTRDHNTH